MSNSHDIYCDATSDFPDDVAVHSEMIFQWKKWGQQDKTLNEWLIDIGEEFGEACQACGDYQRDKGGTIEDLYRELTQVAALAMHLMAVVRIDEVLKE